MRRVIAAVMPMEALRGGDAVSYARRLNKLAATVRATTLTTCAMTIVLMPCAARAQSSPWFDAVSNNDTVSVQRMLDKGEVQIDTPIDAMGDTALHLAAERCHAGLVRILRARGGDPAQRNKYNDSPLRIAQVRCGQQSATALALGDASPSVAAVAASPPAPAPAPKPAEAADSAKKYVVVGMHLDQVMQPKDPFDASADCQNNEICARAIKAISAASGYPIDKVVAVAAVFSSANFGEGNGFNIGLPSGYRYCSASFKLTSIVPHDGDTGSRILLRADDSGLYAETWTPKQPLFGARSWVEGDITVVGIRADLAGSTNAGGTPCNGGGGRVFFWCRGGGCEGELTDKGRTIDAANGPPGAGQRWE